MLEPFQQLEQEFGTWTGLENIVACSSGSAALHLALEALQLPQGSEIIVPDFAMIACARPCTLAGLTPVFVDCGDDLLIDPNLIEAAITDRTRAIMPVHVYGRVCNMEVIWGAAQRHNLHIIEDCAEAHGAHPYPCTYVAACWSFYQNKIVSGAEGGAVAFRERRHADLARQLRCLGFTKDHDFLHVPRGHNYRMSNVHAALILDSLANVDANLARRREIESWYDAECPDEWRMPKRDAPWVYDLRIPGMDSWKQASIVRELQEHGIAARMAFKPMSIQPEYALQSRVGREPTRALVASREVLYCPLDPSMVTNEMARSAFDVLRRRAKGE